MPTTGCIYTCLLAFIATLAYIIGARFPAETRVIAAGVLTGVVAGIPTSLLIGTAATRALLARHTAARAAAAAAAAEPDPEPQVIVLPAAPPAPVQPAPRPQQATPGAQADPATTYATPTPTKQRQADGPGARRFTIIGGTGQDD